MYIHNKIVVLGKEKVVETLIKNGANVNQVNAEGRSPLHAASSNGNNRAV